MRPFSKGSTGISPVGKAVRDCVVISELIECQLHEDGLPTPARRARAFGESISAELALAGMGDPVDRCAHRVLPPAGSSLTAVVFVRGRHAVFYGGPRV